MTDIRLIIGETGYTRHMTSVGDLDEDTLVDRITDILRPCPGLGPGDDAAVLNRPKGKMVLTSDVVTFERHLPRGMSFEHFGWTAAAVNFSDLASWVPDRPDSWHLWNFLRIWMRPICMTSSTVPISVVNSVART